MKRSVRAAGIPKPATSHSLRHSFATCGWRIRKNSRNRSVFSSFAQNVPEIATAARAWRAAADNDSPCHCAGRHSASITATFDTSHRLFPVQVSGRGRCLIESAAMLFPCVSVEHCNVVPVLNRSSSVQGRTRAMVVEKGLELGQFFGQVRRGPEQHLIQALSSNSSDQPLHGVNPILS